MYKIKRYYLIFKLIITSLKDKFPLIFFLYTYSIIRIINIHFNKVVSIRESFKDFK